MTLITILDINPWRWILTYFKCSKWLVTPFSWLVTPKKFHWWPLGDPRWWPHWWPPSGVTRGHQKKNTMSWRCFFYFGRVLELLFLFRMGLGAEFLNLSWVLQLIFQIWKKNQDFFCLFAFRFGCCFFRFFCPTFRGSISQGSVFFGGHDPLLDFIARPRVGNCAQMRTISSEVWKNSVQDP